MPVREGEGFEDSVSRIQGPGSVLSFWNKFACGDSQPFTVVAISCF